MSPGAPGVAPAARAVRTRALSWRRPRPAAPAPRGHHKRARTARQPHPWAASCVPAALLQSAVLISRPARGSRERLISLKRVFDFTQRTIRNHTCANRAQLSRPWLLGTHVMRRPCNPSKKPARPPSTGGPSQGPTTTRWGTGSSRCARGPHAHPSRAAPRGAPQHVPCCLALLSQAQGQALRLAWRQARRALGGPGGRWPRR